MSVARHREALLCVEPSPTSMVRPSKKILLIALSVIFGVGIIFFAVYGGSFFGSNKQPKAANGDLLSVVSQDSLGGAASAQRGLASATSTSGAITTTGLAGRKALANALAYQTNSDQTISDSQAQAVAEDIIKNTLDQNPAKIYTRKDIVIVPMTTASFEAYRKGLSQALSVFSKENATNELLIVAQAIDTKDPKKLIPLRTSVDAHKKLIATLLAIKTPEIMADLHVMIIQGYATTLSGVQDFQQIFLDPAQGMNGLAKYQSGMNLIMNIKDVFAKTQ